MPKLEKDFPYREYLYTVGVWGNDSIGIEVGSYGFKFLILSILIYVVRTFHLFLKFYMCNSSKQL